MSYRQDEFCTNPYTGKTYPKRKNFAPKTTEADETMVHPAEEGAASCGNDESFDLESLFNTGAHKNKNKNKRKPTMTGSVAESSRRTRQKHGNGKSDASAVPENINVNVSEDIDDVDDGSKGSITAASSEDFERKVRAVIDMKIGDDFENVIRKKFVKAIRDPITKSCKENLERFKGDVLPKLNVVNDYAKNAYAKSVHLQMMLDEDRQSNRKFQKFMVEKLGQLYARLDAQGEWMLTRFGSAVDGRPPAAGRNNRMDV
ncbi:hypothetical protein SEMRO_1059_G236580.1 [Seminavis robusta]|uniref:Uncharacterized protein n=1 Tax=Seminavis robusta TaxID=568900 RepID=A0A9N8EEE1_9STRA|nr:hypothetical protein SEMRO_1059_G236580.1 [Seminavis robusta]|eukprot:Sro1059_g236580.1 n/a (259) ;mRNA; f:36230-37006